MNLAQDVYKSGMTQEEFIRELYYEASIIISRMHNPKATREQIISGEKGKVSKLLKEIKDGTEPISVSTVLNAVYNARRFADINEGNAGITGLQTALEKRDLFVIKKSKNNWNFRIPREVDTKAPTVERLIVNAKPDSDIVKKLDNFCRRHNCYYKIPDPNEFSTRVDTVVVYANESLSSETKKQFAEMMAPYVRKERMNDLDGDKLADGIFWAPESSKQEDITAVVERFSPEMQDDIRSYLTTPQGSLMMSPGQRKVLEEFATVLDDIKPNQSERSDMENNTVYDSFVNAYLAANGKIDGIDMSKQPDEIQKMFANNDYEKQIQLFEYCANSDKVEDKDKKQLGRQIKNLEKLGRIVSTPAKLKKEIEGDLSHYNSLDDDKKDRWRQGLETFLREQVDRITDPKRKERVETYLRFLADPEKFDINSIVNDNPKVTFTNGANGGSNPNSGNDYEEAIDQNHPKTVNKIKKSFEDFNIAIRATKPNQQDYPFEYNLYGKNVRPSDQDKPTGKLEITAEDHVILISQDINQFVAVMKGLKADGKTEVSLDLKGSEAEKKTFAANVVIAAMLTGMEVKDNPYSMEDLKSIDPRIEKVMDVQAKIAKTREKAQTFEADNQNDTAKTELETQIKETFASYQQVAEGLLPKDDQLRVFACGAKAVEAQHTRKVAMEVAKQMQGSQGRN